MENEPNVAYLKNHCEFTVIFLGTFIGFYLLHFSALVTVLSVLNTWAMFVLVYRTRLFRHNIRLFDLWLLCPSRTALTFPSLELFQYETKMKKKRNEIVIHAAFQAKDTNPFRIVLETLMKKTILKSRSRTNGDVTNRISLKTLGWFIRMLKSEFGRATTKKVKMAFEVSQSICDNV